MNADNTADLQNLVLTSPIGIAILDAATLVIEMANDAYVAVAGKLYSALKGRYFWEVFPEAAPYYSAALANVVQTGKAYHADEVELMLVRHGREEVFFVTFSYIPLKNEQGFVTKVIVWAVENSGKAAQVANEELAAINEELRSTNEELIETQLRLHQLNDKLEERVSERTKELQESESRFRLLMEKAPVAINVFEPYNLVVTFANEKMLELWDKKPEDMNRPFREIFPELDGQPFFQLLEEVYATGQPYYGHENKASIIRNGQIEIGYFNLVYQPIKNIHGAVVNIIQVLTEVTNQVTARVKMVQSRQLLETAVEAADIGTYIIDRVNTTLTASPRLKELFGYHADGEMSYDTAIAHINEQYRGQVVKGVEAAFTEGKAFFEEYTITRYHDGAVRWMRGVGRVDKTTVVGTTYFLGAIVDITDQVQSRQAEQRLNEELSAINEELMTTNDELRQSQNEYFKVYEQLLKNQEDLLFTIDAASLVTFDITPSTGKVTGNNLLKTWFGMPPEEEIEWMAATAAIVEEDRQRVINAINEAMRYESGGHYDIEYAIYHPHQSAHRMVRARGKAKFDENNQPIRLSGILQDISEQKKDDQRKNDFINMVSHEMKTPLTSISGYLQFLELKTQQKGDDFSVGILQKTNKQVGKMKTMINGFLNLSRLESGKLRIEKTLFNMADLVLETKEETVSSISTHRFVFEPVEPAFVQADKDKIGHVISNLISNSVKYSPIGSTIQLACTTIDGMARVSVQDHGIGLQPEDIGKIFNRYYRVEGDTSISGFGIGLYLSAEIIHRHQGEIWAESTLGTGSTFYFSLPVGLNG